MQTAKMVLDYLDVNEIRPNPYQPRKTFDDAALQELANSIKERNIIQPIVVRKHGSGYQIVAGERRWRAYKKAGMKSIPAIVKDIHDGEIAVLLESLTENLHRLDLSDPEREEAIYELWTAREELGIKTVDELAKAIGFSKQWTFDNVNAWERRLKAKSTGLTSEQSQKIPTTVFRALERAKPTEDEQKQVLKKVVEDKWRRDDVDAAATVLRNAPAPIKREILKPSTTLTPQVAKKIVERLPESEDQIAIATEARQQRLTPDEVDRRIDQVKESREKASITIPIQRGQWLVENLNKNIGNLMAVNVHSYKELTEPQKEQILDRLVVLQKRVAEWISYLEGVKIIDVD